MARNRCDTKLEIHTANYLWIIHDYDFQKAMLPKGRSLKSSVFHVLKEPTCKWYLNLYPNGKEGIGNDGAIFLCLDSTSECKEVLGKFEFFILNETRGVVKKDGSKRIRKFAPSANNDSWGFDNFIDNTRILRWNRKLTIECEVTFSLVTSIAQPFNQSNSIKPGSDVMNFGLNEDLRKLFENQVFSDVTLAVKNKEFRAHKLILKARSPVFAAMFKHEEMEENRNNKVIIWDLDESVVEEMLNYIYTDKLKNLEKLAGGLLAAAEKYGLNGLKELSQDALIANISVENAIDTLILADLYQAPKIKSRTICYIVEKSAIMMKSIAWKNLCSTHPHLILEVCNAVTDELHSGTKKSFVERKWGFLERFLRIWKI